MATRTYAQLKSIVSSRLGRAAGTLTASDFNMALNMALDGFLQEVDIPEAQKTVKLTPALFKDVLTYSPPSDLRGDSIIDIRPLIEIPNHAIDNNWGRFTTTNFSTNNLGDRDLNKFTVEYNGGSSYLKLLANLPSVVSVSVNNCDTYDGNGTWTADTTGSDATNVQTDTVNYFEGSGAVSFDVDVSQSANNFARIYNGSMNEVDLSDMMDDYIFFYVYLPATTNITGVTLRFASDSSATPSTIANYLTFTATTQFNGEALVAGRNLFGIQRTSGVATGTIDLSSVKYVDFALNYGAGMVDTTGFLLDGIYDREGQLFEVRYYTNAIIVPATGANKQYFTADDDTTLMSPDGEMTYIEYATMFIAPNLKDFTNFEVFAKRSNQAMLNFKLRYPSERKKTMKNWYSSISD